MTSIKKTKNKTKHPGCRLPPLVDRQIRSFQLFMIGSIAHLKVIALLKFFSCLIFISNTQPCVAVES